MRIVLRGPLEELAGRRERARVFAQAVFSAHDVMIRHHAAGYGFVRPHAPLRLRLGNAAPADRPRGPSRVHIGRHLAFLHGAANPALHCASPDRVRLPRLGLDCRPGTTRRALPARRGSPWSGFRRPGWQNRSFRAFLFGDGIIKLPEIDGALVELIPILDAFRSAAGCGRRTQWHTGSLPSGGQALVKRPSTSYKELISRMMAGM